jgi:hypothetical protein
MSTLTGQWSLQKFGETLISRTRFGLFAINKSIHVADVPTKTVIIRPDDKPFMNSSIRKAIPKRNRIHYRAKSTNNPDHWSQYRHLRNDVIRLVREAKELFINGLSSGLIITENLLVFVCLTSKWNNKIYTYIFKYPTRQMVENCQISL